MTKKSSLLDDVLSHAGRTKRGTKTWFEKLPPDAQSELDAVKKAFNPSIHEKNSYASAVIAAAKERGWQISGRQGVIHWLTSESR